METILNFFSETLVMEWLWGQEILDVVNDYFLSQSDSNKVLLIIGVMILSALGAINVVKAVFKLTFFWLKVVLFVGLAYYLFVVILGVDIWGLFGL